MNAGAVQFTLEATEQVTALRDYITDQAGERVARNYIDGLLTHCERLALFPQAGRPRDDIRPRLRITAYKKRVTIAYLTTSDRPPVVLGIFSGGQDFEAIMASS